MLRKARESQKPKRWWWEKEKGGSEKGYQQKQALKIANRNKGEVELCTLECCALTDNCGNGDNSLTSRRMNDNKQPRELSMSQSHTQWASGLRFPFQKHTLPVQTTMTTAYTYDHTQVSVQDGSLKETKSAIDWRCHCLDWKCMLWQSEVWQCTSYTLTALRPSVYLIILFILNFISVPNEIFVGICSLIF